MPKEVFRDARGPWPLLGEESTETVDLGLEVSWGMENMVHIGSANLNNMSPGSPERGWVVEVDRKAINDLIKTLRKARDQAYGADE